MGNIYIYQHLIASVIILISIILLGQIEIKFRIFLREYIYIYNNY